MSIKEKYQIYKEALSDKMLTAIAQFEEETGCTVLKVGFAPLVKIHPSNMSENKKRRLVDIAIETDIDKRD